MEEIGHVPPQLWTTYGTITVPNGSTWIGSGKLSNLPTPQAKLIYFSMFDEAAGGAGILTLCLPTSTPHGNLIATSDNVLVNAVKSWSVSTQTGNIYDVYCPIPLAFDTNAPSSFYILNGTPDSGQFRANGTMGFVITVLPEH